MISNYASVKYSRGQYAAGLFKVLIAPREWLVDDIIRDFNTGTVTNKIFLTTPHDFLELEFTPDTYEFIEKPKASKTGDFFDVTVKGTVNNITPATLLAMETFRYHEMIAVLFDNRKRQKVVGTISNGLRFSFSNKENNNQGGLQICDIDMGMEAEQAAPFYNV